MHAAMLDHVDDESDADAIAAGRVRGAGMTRIEIVDATLTFSTTWVSRLTCDPRANAPWTTGSTRWLPTAREVNTSVRVHAV